MINDGLIKEPCSCAKLQGLWVQALIVSLSQCASCGNLENMLQAEASRMDNAP